jgi:SAM-dependent methyltransferase
VLYTKQILIASLMLAHMGSGGRFLAEERAPRINPTELLRTVINSNLVRIKRTTCNEASQSMPSAYDKIGTKYSDYRRPDPRIASAILNEIGDAHRIVNIGAGVGSYEPSDRRVVAVEPSRVMISQRPESGAPVIQAHAENLPFRDGAFDVATAILTIHHWTDFEKGLQEAYRVATRRIVMLTWIGFVEDFWLLDYLPNIREIDEPLFPSIDRLSQILGSIRVLPALIPYDCTDGFLCAYWRRPHAYLDENVRSAISTFSRITDIWDGLQRLQKDLESGLWHQRYQELLHKDYMDFGYRLVVCDKEDL